MTVTAEWRTDRLFDHILVVDAASRTVLEALPPDSDILTDFLNSMHDLEHWRGKPVIEGQRDPDTWGELVIARAGSGEVLEMNPEVFWEQIYRWFRSRGLDPNSMDSALLAR